MTFLSSLLSKKLGVSAAVAALIEQLPMTADTKGVCLAAVAVVFVVAQAYVDAHSASGSGPETPAA